MIVYLLCVCVCVGGCMQEREREPFKLSFCMDLYQILARTGIILLTVIVLEHKNHTDIALKGVHSGDATRFVASKSIALEQSVILNLCTQTHWTKLLVNTWDYII